MRLNKKFLVLMTLGIYVFIILNIINIKSINILQNTKLLISLFLLSFIISIILNSIYVRMFGVLRKMDEDISAEDE